MTKPEYKTCEMCHLTKKLSTFRVANGYRGRADICRACESERDILTCTKCGKVKPVSEFGIDNSKSNGRHSWCFECKRDNTNARHAREKEEFGSRIPDARRTAHGKPKWKPTALYEATPKKPRSEWTEAERRRYLSVLLDPERRAKAAELRKGRVL